MNRVAIILTKYPITDGDDEVPETSQTCVVGVLLEESDTTYTIANNMTADRVSGYAKADTLQIAKEAIRDIQFMEIPKPAKEESEVESA